MNGETDQRSWILKGSVTRMSNWTWGVPRNWSRVVSTPFTTARRPVAGVVNVRAEHFLLEIRR